MKELEENSVRLDSCGQLMGFSPEGTPSPAFGNAIVGYSSMHTKDTLGHQTLESVVVARLVVNGVPSLVQNEKSHRWLDHSPVGVKAVFDATIRFWYQSIQEKRTTCPVESTSRSTNGAT